MAGYQVSQLGHNGHKGGKGWAGELPVGVGVQLVPTLVAGVERVEEGHRVGDMDHHRQVERAGRGPQRVEPRIIDRHQPAMLIAHVQAEGLPDLEPLGAARGLCA